MKKEKQLEDLCLWYTSSTDKETMEKTYPKLCTGCNGYKKECKYYTNREQMDELMGDKNES